MPALPWLARPLALFALSRLIVLLAVYLGGALAADNPFSPPYHLRGEGNALLDALASRWDTGFYVSIAEHGYRYEGAALPSVAFFPLLPLAMRVGGALTGDVAVAGILISHAALLLATILFYALVSQRWGEGLAGRAAWYLLIFPSAFFGSAVYSESLFLLAAVGALFLARRGYWESAGLLAFAAGLTRFVGLLVAPLLAVEW